MPHTITAKLNEDAREFQAGESTGFGFRIGERYYDRETQKSEYTNYEGAIFSRNENQTAFLRSALVKGAILTVSCDQLKIDSYTSDNGTTYLKNQMQNCRMDNVFTMDAQTQGQQAPQQPPAQPTTYSPDSPAGVQQMPVGWGNGYTPTAKCNGATMEQVWRKFKGDMSAAIQGGFLAAGGGVADFDDDIPF
jgi:hypothetical protein